MRYSTLRPVSLGRSLRIKRDRTGANNPIDRSINKIILAANCILTSILFWSRSDFVEKQFF